MAAFDRPTVAARPGTAAVIDEGLRSYMLKVYNYMGIGLVVTGLVAWFAASAAVTTDPAAAVGQLQSGQLVTQWGALLFNSPLMWVIALSPLAIVLVPTALVLVQPDLGTAVLIAAAGFIVLFLAGLSWRYVIAVVVAVATAAPVMWQFVLYDYQKRRVLTLLDPESDKLGAGWNIIQSKTAIGSGGVAGKGWLLGTQSHLDFLPEGHTDFIIAVLAEEWGFRGVVLLLALYLALIARALWIALRAQDTFSRLIVGGLSLTFFVYIVVNMGMVSGLLPVVGVPLPLISQGGTALISLLAGFGIIMSVATERRRMLG